MPRHWFLCTAIFAVNTFTVAAGEPVPVRQEPAHHTVFENEHIRILDVRIPPGRSTLWHVHTIPSVMVYPVDLKVGNEEWPHQPMTFREAKAGTTRYAPFHRTPQTHRVTNRGDAPFRVFDIELLKPGFAAKQTLQGNSLVRQWEEEFAATFTLRVTAKEPASVTNARPCLVVAIRGSIDLQSGSQITTLGPGEFRFVQPGGKFAVTTNDSAEAVIVECK